MTGATCATVIISVVQCTLIKTTNDPRHFTGFWNKKRDWESSGEKKCVRCIQRCERQMLCCVVNTHTLFWSSSPSVVPWCPHCFCVPVGNWRWLRMTHHLNTHAGVCALRPNPACSCLSVCLFAFVCVCHVCASPHVCAVTPLDSPK